MTIDPERQFILQKIKLTEESKTLQNRTLSKFIQIYLNHRHFYTLNVPLKDAAILNMNGMAFMPVREGGKKKDFDWEGCNER